MKKAQINRILKGIKLAVEVLNLREEMVFAETSEQVNAIQNKINSVAKKALDNHFTEVGYMTTMQDKSVLSLNLHFEGIAETIYTRNESIILDNIDVTKVNN